MTQPSFDAAGALEFDLARGSLTFDGKVAALAVPTSALDALFKRAPADIVEGFGKRLGSQAAECVRERVGEHKLSLSLDGVTEHLGGAFALLGLGNLQMERWGKALVVNISGIPLKSAHVAIVRSALESALLHLFERTVKGVAVSQDESSVKLLVVAPDVAPKVEAWVQQGFSWGELLDKLHRGVSA
ncbi:MAG: hypothetical protein SFV15_26640 [Polyangiaceae bacterium]|nr:hypothetical protein [Polyangiaceae bacterium]